MKEDKVLWKGSPSQVTNLFWFIFSIFIIPIPIAAWKWIGTRLEIYELTEERIKDRYGVINKHVNMLELYRVRDYVLQQPWYLRIFGLGNIILITWEKTTKNFEINAIKKPEKLVELLRKRVEVCRVEKKVREVDYAS